MINQKCLQCNYGDDKSVFGILFSAWHLERSAWNIDPLRYSINLNTWYFALATWKYTVSLGKNANQPLSTGILLNDLSWWKHVLAFGFSISNYIKTTVRESIYSHDTIGHVITWICSCGCVLSIHVYAWWVFMYSHDCDHLSTWPL